MRQTTLLGIAVLFVIFGCGGGGGGGGGSNNGTVNLGPLSATLTLNDSTTFTANIVGSPGAGVNWTVQEGAAGGSITTGGVYTAPGAPGTFHVIATSQLDPTKTATATITVQAGSATGTIN